MTLDEILKEIKAAEKIVVLTHESPDGDAIGAALAMKFMVEALGKNVDVIIPEYPRMFQFLPESKEIKIESEVSKYDLAISVDCATFKRMAKNEYFENAKKTIVIDHHGSNNMYGDLNYVNPASPACCEILLSMAEYFGITISKNIGTCLMAGIITDTGGFRYMGVTPDTFEGAADLLRIGVDVPDIYKRTMGTKTKANFQLSKKVIDRMEFLEEGKVAFSYINTQDELEANAEPGDHEGLVNIGKDIEGVLVSIFIRQKDDEEAYKVSLRSEDGINVSDICLLFGGGGHSRAAGALVQGSVQEVKEKLMKEIKKWME